MNESIVAKTTITVPVNGGAVEAVSTIETVPYWTRSRKKSGENLAYMTIQNKISLVWGFDQYAIVSSVAPAWGDTTTTDQSETVSEAPSTSVSDIPAILQTPKPKGGKKHHFVSKTVRLCSCLSFLNDLRYFSTGLLLKYNLFTACTVFLLKLR